MQSLTRDAAAAWCKSQGIPLDDRGRPAPLDDVEPFDIPEDSGKKIHLVNFHMLAFRDVPELLVWITDWSVWPSSERPHIFRRFRQSYGETRWLDEVPAQLFSRTEYEDAVSCATLGVLFLWDVFLVAEGGVPRAHYSHDEDGWTSYGVQSADYS